MSSDFSALAFDFGTQRIGVAFGQSVTGTASAVTVLKARDGQPRWNEMAQLVEQWKPDVFLVGLPYNIDGTVSELLGRAEKFARRLQERFDKPCYGMDERLSSREAIERLVEANTAKTIKKTAIDHIAAQIILENWFNEIRVKPS
ncbi:MAG: Holliday junction resolvase RuvX [Gammaproteobacteria bacterium]|nr:Holliday junction resolvase RuvX [Gammaproteobacteria bacterium]MXY89440.1 Holliday junction resolvase RuvX [Gammaproteobacteria bacterium]MYA36170.1 Holliday junction resolvase RuvX [Gammaproteobacteria bacterium]MYA67261.1 Holliday junction resolvase RuvX [Gammaproteobacteria bacterium]MYE30091.1 Holliday junction resolvase RuvX [Gammaproteobacteria bacterium]